MLPLYNYLTALVGICTAVFIIYLVRRDTLSPNYTVWWISVALGLAIAGFFPGLVDIVGSVLGIAYPPILLVVLSWCLILVKLLFMDIDRSKQERRIKILMQRLAIYEEELRDSQQGKKK